MYKIFHKHEVEIKPVCFTIPAIRLEQLKDLAVYIQFKAESLLNPSIVLNGEEILGYLKRFGAKIIDQSADDFAEIDMFQDRVERLGEWRAEVFPKLDETYGPKATAYIQKLRKNATV